MAGSKLSIITMGQTNDFLILIMYSQSHDWFGCIKLEISYYTIILFL